MRSVETGASKVIDSAWTRRRSVPPSVASDRRCADPARGSDATACRRMTTSTSTFVNHVRFGSYVWRVEPVAERRYAIAQAFRLYNDDLRRGAPAQAISFERRALPRPRLSSSSRPRSEPRLGTRPADADLPLARLLLLAPSAGASRRASRPAFRRTEAAGMQVAWAMAVCATVFTGCSAGGVGSDG